MLNLIIAETDKTCNLAAHILSPGQPNYTKEIQKVNRLDKVDKIELDAECHWLSFEGELKENQKRRLILFIFGTDPFYTSHEGKKKRFKADIGFTHKAIGEYGQYVCWTDPHEDTGLSKVVVSLPGSWIESNAGLVQTMQKIVRLRNEFGLHVTRIDLAVNDYGKKLNLFSCIDAVYKKNYTGFKNYRILQSGDSEEGMTGLTIECGSRESESFTRFYETTVKHDYTANRIECEFKGEKAREVVKQLIQTFYRYKEAVKDGQYLIDAHRQYLADILAVEVFKYTTGQIDFIDRAKQESNGKIKNCDRLKFWQEFLDRVTEPIKVKLPRRKPSLKSIYNWFQRQIAKSLYILDEGLGIEGLYTFIESLKTKAKKKLEKDGKLKDGEARMKIALLNEYGIMAMLTDCEQRVDNLETIMLI